MISLIINLDYVLTFEMFVDFVEIFRDHVIPQ